MPSLHFYSRVLNDHKPVSIQAFSSELAIEALDEGVAGRLARMEEVQGHALGIKPTDPDRGSQTQSPDRLLSSSDSQSWCKPAQVWQRTRLSSSLILLPLGSASQS